MDEIVKRLGELRQFVAQCMLNADSNYNISESIDFQKIGKKLDKIIRYIENEENTR